MIGQLARWLRPSSAPQIPDALWLPVFHQHPFLQRLNANERDRLRALCSAFLADKEFSAAGDFQLTDTLCLSIAMQGCLPILNLDLSWYRGWHGIIVYPNEFVIPRELPDEDGIVHRYNEVAAGEAWGDGPLILSWQDAQMTDDVYNVVIHEFAHKLDMLNGDADGCPPLHQEIRQTEWRSTLHGAYEDFCRRVDAAPAFDDAIDEYDIDLESILDPYAATHPGEFFAVASETFFTAPSALEAEYPVFFAQLAAFYRQSPITRR